MTDSPRHSPTFSVIIPNYNNGSTLARAIRSVQAQTYPAHEIIVIDDGSSDDSAAVAAQFAGQIIYVKQPNSGVAVARNHGAQRATGDWLAFVDADDEFTPDRLAAHAGSHSPPQPISSCSEPTTVTWLRAGFGSAVVTVTGLLVTGRYPGSRSTAR